MILELNNKKINALLSGILENDFENLFNELSYLFPKSEIINSEIIYVDSIFTKKILKFENNNSYILVKHIQLPKYISTKNIYYFYLKQKELNLVSTTNYFLFNPNFEDFIEICIEPRDAELLSEAIKSNIKLFYIFFNYIVLFLETRKNKKIGLDVKLSNFIYCKNKISNIDFIPPIIDSKSFKVKSVLKKLFEKQNREILKTERPEYLHFGFYNSKGILFRFIFTLLIHRIDLIEELKTSRFQNKLLKIDKRFYDIFILALMQRTILPFKMDCFEFRIFTNLSYLFKICEKGDENDFIKNLDIHFNLYDFFPNAK